MDSIWRETAALPAREALHGDLEAEAVVVGGGMAGILTAYFLQKRGLHTVLLEAAQVGSGQTQNTTAKITSQHGLIYSKLLETMGAEKARQYLKANQAAIDMFRRVVSDDKINCHFEERPAYLYAVEDAEALKREAEAARSLGMSAAFVTETELPFDVAGAVRFDGQAQFQPLEFLRAVAAGVRVFENTRVKTVEGNRVETANGTVTAKHIIFATHFPFVNFPGYYFLRMHQSRSYVLALEAGIPLHGMYLGTEKGEDFSLRSAGELLLFGGAEHRTGENRGGGRYDELRRRAGALWPGAREAAHWSAQDCMTLDGVPYVGRFSSATPNWWVATGFGKWGMTGSMNAATTLAALIAGEEPECAEVFSPQRFTPGASAKSLLEEGTQAVRGLSRQPFAPPRAEAEALPPGHGGVVSCDGEKLGVYKAKDGEVFVVNTRCPHLGCQLEWNPDEKSWDCPCHGSRFDFRGELICGPAQEGLAHA